jgi:hypothetical protein
MTSYEREQSRSSPLSPEVVRGFVNACANINKYGEHVRAKRIVLDELNIINDNLEINENADFTTATHQASGNMRIPVFNLSIYQVELWTPLESVAPRQVVLLGQEVTLKTVMRDGVLDSELSNTQGHVRSVITTAEDRIFAIDTYGNLGGGSVREYTADTQAELENEILAAFAHDLNEQYPEKA